MTSIIKSADNLHKLRSEKELIEVTMQYLELAPATIIHEYVKDHYTRKHKEAERRYLMYKHICKKNPLILFISF
jgi:hypothetical protein